MAKTITLSIPCPTCGCDTFIGHCRTDGTPIKVTVCACNDGSGYFNMNVIYDYSDSEKITEDWHNFKSKEEVESFLNNCYNATDIKHHCGGIVVTSIPGDCPTCK